MQPSGEYEFFVELTQLLLSLRKQRAAPEARHVPGLAAPPKDGAMLVAHTAEGDLALQNGAQLAQAVEPFPPQEVDALCRELAGSAHDQPHQRSLVLSCGRAACQWA